MRYSPKYFRDNLPEYKKKEASVAARFFYREASFYFSALFYKMGLTANRVSFLGTILAFAAAGLFLFPFTGCWIAGTVLCVLWMIMDCADGNLARGVAKQPYGAFIDACGSYTIVALVLPAVGFAAYNHGSVFFNESPWIILIGALGGIADALARLYFQKFANEKMRRDGITDGSEQPEDAKIWRMKEIYSRIQQEIGIPGLMLPFLLFASIFRFLDIFSIFYFLFYGANYLVSFAILIHKTKCLKK